jgi:hypothetical protein
LIPYDVVTTDGGLCMVDKNVVVSKKMEGFFDRNHHHLGNPRFRRSRRLAVGATEGNGY